MKRFSLLLLYIISTHFFYAQDYTVQSIGYNPPNSPSQGVSVANIDDFFTDEIDIGFDFNFYGNQYNQIIIGTNGVLSFDFNLAGGNCEWNFDDDVPNPEFPILNSIFPVYTDMDGGVNPDSEITYGIYGTAPNRRFVCNFNNQVLYSISCNEFIVTFQVVLYETTNTIEVYIADKPACTAWNGGKAVVGIINSDGNQGLAAPGRNTSNSPWETTNEAWSFSYYQGTTVEAFDATISICDAEDDGVENFDLPMITPFVIDNQTDVMVTYHATFLDASDNVNALISPYQNSQNPEIIYARVENSDGLYDISEVTLDLVSCLADSDNDGIMNGEEDYVGNGFLSSTDSDNDGIPDFLDPDDDNDSVNTSIEILGIGAGFGPQDAIDTDGDGLENYLDNDDDDDGILTKYEDYNQNGNPLDDDTNSNGIPDFLDPEVGFVMSVSETGIRSLQVYPNPFQEILTIESKTHHIQRIAVVNMKGQLIMVMKGEENMNKLDLSALPAALYFITVEMDGASQTFKVVKQ
ncbi:T9SS type A sorting domain-containing protein [Luteirhabdus pelagi]|uniref:T9SS type A sorting domain-containing protein n=1 Tax=Luteirhabdus pelagi TaxID=2792783 RepID=UPI00193A9F2C|nr:T9SS type A sorting domain-containing protein [Luteirhabdus pelagi]